MDANVIEIIPKTQLLAPSELTKQRHRKVKPVQVGCKRTIATRTTEETNELELLYAQLRQQLSVPRIDSFAKRIAATWLADKQAAKVKRKVGKLDHFGYNANGDYYLDCYETLFLLELGRLKLDYCGILVSVEQAYVLALGEQASEKYNEYLVYSNLSRVGFILVKHKHDVTNTVPLPTESDCIWAVLRNALEGTPIPPNVQTASYFEEIQEQFQQLKSAVIKQEHKALNNTKEEPWRFDAQSTSSNKRKANSSLDGLVIKRPCNAKPKSFLDVLKCDAEYQQFQAEFASFELVELSTNCNVRDTSNLTINFDLYLHNDGFKRSTPKTPTFRIIILAKAARFPTHDELSACFQQQSTAVPLLVVSVSDSKQLHAFLFYFS